MPCFWAYTVCLAYVEMVFWMTLFEIFCSDVHQPVEMSFYLRGVLKGGGMLIVLFGSGFRCIGSGSRDGFCEEEDD